MDTCSPSWSRSLKSGARTPAGSTAPSKLVPEPATPASSRESAASTTAPRAKTPIRKSAMTTRACTRVRLAVPVHPAARLRLDQAAPDRVAHELDSVAHLELREHVGAVRLDRLLG